MIAIGVPVMPDVPRITVTAVMISGVTGIPVAVRLAVSRSTERLYEDANHRVAVSRTTVWAGPGALTEALTPVALAIAVLIITVASSAGTDGVAAIPVAVAVAVFSATVTASL